MPEGARPGLRRRALAPLLAAPWLAAVHAGEPVPRESRVLRVDFMLTSGAQRSAWVRAIEQFQRTQPGLQVINAEFEQERYKRDFEPRVASGETDVAFWFAGERLQAAIQKGLIAPLASPPLLQSLREGFGKALLDASQLEGQTYAMPLAYYPWGFLYRKSLFSRWGVRPPATWAEFLVLCEQLKALGVVPTAVGAQEGWPAAAWFDFLDLRLNGLEAHRATLAHDPGLTGPAARKVLLAWQGLLRRGYFHPGTTGQGWASVLPYLYRGEIGMALLGSFALTRVPAALRADIGFFGFPTTGLPAYEEAPLDVLVVPAASRQQALAQDFLAFMARPEVLGPLAEATGQLSPRLDAPLPADPVLREGRRVLDRAAGLSFFFDRDIRQGWVEPAFSRFRRLMTPPHDLS